MSSFDAVLLRLVDLLAVDVVLRAAVVRLLDAQADLARAKADQLRARTRKVRR